MFFKEGGNNMASNVVAKEGYPPKTKVSMEHPQLEDAFRIQTRFFQLVMLTSRGAIAKNIHKKSSLMRGFADSESSSILTEEEGNPSLLSYIF